MATEIADGWLPLFYSPFRQEVYADSLRNLKPGFDVACPVTVVIGDDLESALIPIKWALAFYIGGMGAASKNFHLNLIGRLGFEEDAKKVQKLFLEGKRAEAAAAVPDAARRRDLARRSAGAHPRPPAGLARQPRHDHPRRHARRDHAPSARRSGAVIALRSTKGLRTHE